MKFKDKWLPEVRAYMRFYDIPQRELALRLGVGKNYINDCMTAKKAFTTEEAYMILDLFEIQHEHLHEWFPPLPEKAGARARAG